MLPVASDVQRGAAGFAQNQCPLGFCSYSSFQKPAAFPAVLGGFVERRMPGKNGEGSPRVVTGWFPFTRVLACLEPLGSGGHPPPAFNS